MSWQRTDAPEVPCTFVADQAVTVAGMAIYGTPWSTGISYQAWAFEEEDDFLEGLAGQAPKDLDTPLIPAATSSDAHPFSVHPEADLTKASI